MKEQFNDDRGVEISRKDPTYYKISKNSSKNEFISVVKTYAKSVVSEFDMDVDVRALNWEVSSRAKRRAGAVKHHNGDPKSISITWDHFQKNGWLAVASTIRHELIHVHLLNLKDDSTHGPNFQKLANKLDAPLHCERFSEPKWWVICEECDLRIERYQKSNLVKSPHQYRCGSCGGKFYVKENL